MNVSQSLERLYRTKSIPYDLNLSNVCKCEATNDWAKYPGDEMCVTILSAKVDDSRDGPV